MSITVNLVIKTSEDMLLGRKRTGKAIPYFSKKQILPTYEDLY